MVVLVYMTAGIPRGESFAQFFHNYRVTFISNPTKIFTDTVSGKPLAAPVLNPQKFGRAIHQKIDVLEAAPASI